MRASKSLALTGLVIMMVLSIGLHGQSDHKLLFEKARFAMETKGDLQGAIKLFQEIVAKYPKEKEYASKAQLYIGLCYEKLGNAEAVKAYELVLRNFADRPEEVAVARERLTAIRLGTSGDLSTVNLPIGEASMDLYDISRDGSKVLGIAYEFDGTDNIAVYDITTKRRRLITHFDLSDSSYSAEAPVWSPDEKEIVFEQTSHRPGAQTSELRSLNLEGKSRLLCSTEDGNLWPQDWLNDGSAVVVLWRHHDQAYTLGLVPAKGGPFNALCEVQTTVYPYAAASPDGRYVAFTEGSRNSRSIRIIRLADARTQVIRQDLAVDRNPVWSSDGRLIAFISSRHGGFALWAQSMDGGEPVGQPFLVRDVSPDSGLLGWTEQGLVCDGNVTINDVFLQSVDPEKLEFDGKPRLLPYQPRGNNAGPRWSPDGKRIAFASSAKGNPAQVRVVLLPSQGGNARDFLAPIFYWVPVGHNISWLADGRSLGFFAAGAHTETGQSILCRLDPTTGEWTTWPVPFESEYSGSAIEWSRTGRTVFYVKQDNEDIGSIVERDPATGAETLIYRSEKRRERIYRDIRLSPDRRQLLFRKDRGVGSDKSFRQTLTILDLESGSAKDIYSSAEDMTALAWSPDQHHILFVYETGPRQPRPEVGFVSSLGGPIKRLKLGVDLQADSDFDNAVFSADWSPDGKEIAFHLWSCRTDLVFVRNISPAAQKK